jgi:hypothetical protein
MKMNSRMPLLLCAALLPLAAFAGHAWQFDTDVAGERAGAWRVDLPPQVYARVLHADLRDLEARNAAGEAVPFGPAPLRYGAPATPALETIELPLFALPRLAPGVPDSARLRLLVERDASGTLRRIDLAEGAAAPVANDLLLDTGSGEVELVALDVALAPAAGDSLRARVAVLASDDLDAWREVGAPQSLLRLAEGGRLLERRALDLGGIRARYLLLRRLDGDGGLPVQSVALRLRRQVAPISDWPQSRLVDADPIGSGKPGEFFYRAPGPIPVDSIEVVPADANSVAEVQVDSRDTDADRWQPRHAGSVFRIAIDGDEAGSLPATIGVTRERLWRISSSPPLSRAPRLRLGYTPDSWVLLAQGEGPFRLVAGSADGRRADYPLERVLDQLAGQTGPMFRLPIATIGEPRALDGEAALKPAPTPPPWRQIALWVVLVLGALAVVVLVLRLLRERDAAA